jgi:hypothetical protein
MGDELDYDDLDSDDGGSNDGRPSTRGENELWVATAEEMAVRNAEEAKLSREELAARHVEWEERVDPLTENVFWVHTATNEISNSMPASLKMKIKLEQEEEENTRNFREAQAKIAAAKKGNKKKKGFR